MKRFRLFIVLGICLFLLITSVSALLIIKNNLKLYVQGNKNVSISVFSEYIDDGVILKFGKKTIKNTKYKVKVSGKYNTNKVGKYKIKYSVNYHGNKLNTYRVLNVYDNVNPDLTTNISTVQKDYCTKKFKQEIKYTASDNYDGDLTDKVTVNEEEDKIIYKVVDSSGNESTKEVKIDYGTKPSKKFILNGQSKTYVVLNKTYEEKGATYTDGCGNNINKEIKISGSVDTSVLGEYKITYSVDGETDITRTVIVREKPLKTIYLTFDDGPGAKTKKILDILDKYNVKATFFVTNQFGRGSYQYLIKEEYDKGHAIGVHTLTHNYNIYESVDAYINDFNAMNEIIKNQTGSYSNIFRFPGGSGNTVSRNYAHGIVTEIANEMTKRGYVYFDWNLSSGDASKNKVPPSTIVSNVLNHVDSCANNCVILFHDYKSETAEAIDPILKELVSREYDFATLSVNSPVVHATIKN